MSSSVSHPRKRLNRNQASSDDNPVLGSDSEAASTAQQDEQPSRLNDEYTADDDYIHQLANIDDDDEEEEEEDGEEGVRPSIVTLYYSLIITIITVVKI